VKQYLSDAHGIAPGDVVSTLENYPPTDTNAMLAKVVTAVQVLVVVGALTIENFVVLPADVRDKKMMIVMGAMFLGNTVRNSLMSTGAFEVLYDDSIVWSKLTTGQMPSTRADIESGLEMVLKAKAE
jgi:selT/selW/selH-like putative selenoprotein